jgi:hypothetical protein
MADYPTFDGGMVVQLPSSRVTRFETIRTDGDGGTRLTEYLYSTPVHVWNLEYPALTDSEAGTLKTFFLARGGRYEEFTFTDPWTTDVHTKCRFGMDELAIRQIAKNYNTCSVVIEEYR